MKILKFLADGVGTGAGVAWPTFGIAASCLGLAAGGLPFLTMTLAVTSIFVFFLVSLPKSYASYLAFKNDAKNSTEDQDYQKSLTENTFDYLMHLTEKIQFKNRHKEEIDARAYLIGKIDKDIRNAPHVSTKIYLQQILSDIKHVPESSLASILNKLHNAALPLNSKKLAKESLITRDPDSIEQIQQFFKSKPVFVPKPLSWSSKIHTGLDGFTGGYGTIAGCSAGLGGVLEIVGVFAGFGAVPVAGWIVLGAAFVFGLTIAGICIYNRCKRDEATQLNNYNKEVSEALGSIVSTRRHGMYKVLKMEDKQQKISEDKAISVTLPLSISPVANDSTFSRISFEGNPSTSPISQSASSFFNKSTSPILGTSAYHDSLANYPG